jgi:hypothetical protein
MTAMDRATFNTILGYENLPGNPWPQQAVRA